MKSRIARNKPDLVTRPDKALINRALEGDKTALETLILRYQDWIFNVALRMVGNPTDAEDVVQEILIKIITRLATYDAGRASFKTWLYRVAVNHMINMKRRGYEHASFNVDNYYERMDHIHDREPADTEEIRVLVEDTMTNCVLATLICLERTQRMVVILGVVLGLDSRTGAALTGLSPANFRQILCRSRARLKNFMSAACSLVNRNASCVCRLKITELVEQGYRRPDQLVYRAIVFDRRVRDMVGGKVRRFMTKYFYPFHDLFRSQPYWRAPDMLAWLREKLEERDFHDIVTMDIMRN